MAAAHETKAHHALTLAQALELRSHLMAASPQTRQQHLKIACNKLTSIILEKNFERGVPQAVRPDTTIENITLVQVDPRSSLETKKRVVKNDKRNTEPD